MELVDVRYIGSDDQYQTYAPSDVALISVNTIAGNYGAPNDYIEYFIKGYESNSQLWTKVEIIKPKLKLNEDI